MTASASKTRKRIISIGISFAFMILFQFLPAPAGLSRSAMLVIGIFIGILILWMTNGIDWTSILCIGAFAFVPELSLNSLLSSGVGNWLFSFLIFTFMCTHALNKTPFIKRVALAFVTNKWARKGPWIFFCLFLLSELVVGAFISSTVCALIFVTIAEEIFHVLGLEKGEKAADMIMVGVMVCSGISGGMTPIAHAYPLLSFGVYEAATGLTIDYVKYITVGIPVALLTVGGMIAMFRLFVRPDMSKIKNPDVRALKAALPPVDGREIACAAIFFCVIILWFAPALIKNVLPGVYKVINGWGTAMPPLLGVVAMSIITYKGEPLLNFKEATSSIPWASPIMAAATLIAGAALTNKDIGISAWVSATLGPVASTLAPFALAALFIIWTLIQTNFASNTVTSSMVSAIAVPVCLAIPTCNTPAIVTLIGMLSAYGFSTPSSMISVVFAVGSGYTTTKSTVKYGFIVLAIAVVVALFVGYPLANLVMG